MTDATIRARLLRAGARLPTRATPGATGFDIYACLEGGSIMLGPRPALVPTGLALEVPPGFDAQVRPRSGLARDGVLSTFGTLDCDYRGELMVCMYTAGLDIRYEVRTGDRIAQLVIAPASEAIFVEVAELSETRRGAGGHGSTGR